jgi:hypothetical protein
MACRSAICCAMTPAPRYIGQGLSAVARHLAGDGGTQRQLRLNQRAFHKIQLFILPPHATLSLSDLLHLEFERG